MLNPYSERGRQSLQGRLQDLVTEKDFFRDLVDKKTRSEEIGSEAGTAPAIKICKPPSPLFSKEG
jgi:hypothetical protein